MSASRRLSRVLGVPAAVLVVLATAVLLVGLLASVADGGRDFTVYPAAAADLGATEPVYAQWGAPVQVVGIGDSVMAGTHCDCAGPVSQYAHGLAQRLHAAVRASDLAENGGTTETLLSQVRSDPAMRSALARARVVLVTIGANDLYPQLGQYDNGSCPSSCYEPAVQAMGQRLATILGAVHRLRGSKPLTVLVTDYWNVFTDGDVARQTRGQSGLDWSNAITIAANKAIEHATTDAGATSGDVFVDTWQPFKGDGDPTHLLASDGDHPNSAGVDVFVDALLRATPLR